MITIDIFTSVLPTLDIEIKIRDAIRKIFEDENLDIRIRG